MRSQYAVMFAESLNLWSRIHNNSSASLSFSSNSFECQQIKPIYFHLPERSHWWMCVVGVWEVHSSNKNYVNHFNIAFIQYNVLIYQNSCVFLLHNICLYTQYAQKTRVFISHTVNYSTLDSHKTTTRWRHDKDWHYINDRVVDWWSYVHVNSIHVCTIVKIGIIFCHVKSNWFVSIEAAHWLNL